MAVKQTATSKGKSAKVSSPSGGDKKGSLGGNVASKNISNIDNKKKSSVLGWIQDASLEVPVQVGSEGFSKGQRELEFSVGMRQYDLEGIMRSELRARALVHAEGAVLALVEASYVCDMPREKLSERLPHEMYAQLKPRLAELLAMSGHAAPLPESLRQVEQ